MIWSKLKKSIEALLADSVKEHLQLHLTRYGPGVSSLMNRAWVTWDGEEISTFSTIQWLRARNLLATEIAEEGEQRGVSDVLRRDKDPLEQRGVYSRDDFYDAAVEYIGLSIEDALQSPNPVIRALSMFDRRLGKRRLLTMHFKEADFSLVRQWYQLRCKAEGLEE